MSSTNRVTAVLTGTGGGGVGEQMVLTLRAAQTPYRIVATDVDSLNQHLCPADKTILVPRARDPSYITRMLEICRDESAQVLIPGSEPELLEVSRHRDLFAKQGVLPLINSERLISLCLDKWQTHLVLQDKGFNPPASCLWGQGGGDIDFEYPVVVKPSGQSGGSRMVFVAQNREELSFFAEYLNRQDCTPMVQKYVGTGNDEYTVGVLTSFEGELLGSIALRRRLSGALSTRYRLKDYARDSEPLLISTGISQGVIDDFPEVRRYAETVALELGSRGPINVQCRVTEDSISVFEINPRFSGTESLRALAGYNAPDTLIRKYVLGEDIAPMHYERGLALRGLDNRFVKSETFDRI